MKICYAITRLVFGICLASIVFAQQAPKSPERIHGWLMIEEDKSWTKSVIWEQKKYLFGTFLNSVGGVTFYLARNCDADTHNSYEQILWDNLDHNAISTNCAGTPRISVRPQIKELHEPFPLQIQLRLERLERERKQFNNATYIVDNNIQRTLGRRVRFLLSNIRSAFIVHYLHV